MSYELLPGEPLADGLRRVALEQIARIDVELERFEADPAGSVHDARRRLKESRALLRLGREMLGEEYVVENAFFRDVGRQLSQTRDHDAAAALLRKLRKELSADSDEASYRSAQRALRQRRRAAAAALPQEVVDTIRIELQKGRERFARTLITPAGFEGIAPGLERTYRRGHRSAHSLREGGAVEEFHEWRKHTKDQWYHLQLLENIEPTMLRPQRDHLNALSKQLGEHHDLAILSTMLQRIPFRRGGRKERLLSSLERRQRELERKAVERGRITFAESPGAFARRLENYWNAKSSLGRP